MPFRTLLRLTLFTSLAITTACSQRNQSDESALDIARLDVELSAFGPSGDPTKLDVDLSSLARDALAKTKRLRLAENNKQGSGPRLRVQAQVSPDRRSDELHVMTTVKIDRTGSIPMTWVARGARPLTKAEGSSLDIDATSRLIGETLAEALEALDTQHHTLRLSTDEQVKALREGSAPAKLAAARALAKSRSENVSDSICAALDDAPEQLEAGLIEALEEIGRASAVTCLAAWAGTTERRLDRAIDVAQAVGGAEAREFLEQLSQAKTSSLRLKARAAAAANRVSGQDTLAKLHKHDHDHDHDHEDHDAPSDPLLKALRHEEREVRIGAARVLASARRADAVEPLCDLLQHEDQETVEAALLALGELQSSRAVPCLIRWSADDRRKLLVVIEVLTMIGGQDAHRVLEMIARDDESEPVRELARAGLRRMAEGSEHRH